MFDRDQASGLRQLFLRQRPAVFVTCGGNPAQASIATRLACAYARDDISVLLLDGTSGEAARALGIAARYELGHVIAGDKRLDEVVHFADTNLAVLPARRGIEQLDGLDPTRARWLKRQFSAWRWPVELLIVNARPLAGSSALDAFGGKARVIVIVSGESGAITSAYAEIKNLRNASGLTDCDIIVSDAHPAHQAREIYQNLAAACAEFLGVTCRLRDHGVAASGIGWARPRPLTLAEPVGNAADGLAYLRKETLHAAFG